MSLIALPTKTYTIPTSLHHDKSSHYQLAHIENVNPTENRHKKNSYETVLHMDSKYLEDINLKHLSLSLSPLFLQSLTGT